MAKEICKNCRYWQASVQNKHGICNKHHYDVLVIMAKYAGIKETDIDAVENFGCNYFRGKETAKAEPQK